MAIGRHPSWATGAGATAALFALCVLAGPAAGQHERLIRRDDYADRLRAMWLAQAIANWTGRQTEGDRVEPPFLTDDDWGQPHRQIPVLTWILDLDPWPADDDTDIEYVYMHELAEVGVTTLTPGQLRQAWIDHINSFIWVSNERARELMERGVFPPATGLLGANRKALRIDAQLTTEMFGALTPGMPEAALALADLAISTTAAGHAAHASQLHVVMHALAPSVPPELAPQDRGPWLLAEATRWIPDTSKAADIAETVLADYLANPDPTDWERTRDLVYERYQRHADANGFRYLGWTESSVNLAGGLIALLYGRGDFLETVRIGTLSGWDSDNGTATMGGLLGLMLGTDALRAQIDAAVPGANPAERYVISVTRDAMPDHLPDDLDAEDRFDLLAQRMLPTIDRALAERDARVGLTHWLLPPAATPTPAFAPTHARWSASATHRVLASGGTITASSSVGQSSPTDPDATSSVQRFANGLETDASGADPTAAAMEYYSSRGAPGSQPGAPITLTVSYSLPVSARVLQLVEGEHWPDGGWFDAPAFEIRIGSVWTPAQGAWTNPPTPAPFELLEFVLDDGAMLTGVRVTGQAGGSAGYVNVAEIDAREALSLPPTPAFAPLDLDADGEITVDDLHDAHAAPQDLDGNGIIDDRDLRYLEAFLRFGELIDATR